MTVDAVRRHAALLILLGGVTAQRAKFVAQQQVVPRNGCTPH
jgi:hypothetical protein